MLGVGGTGLDGFGQLDLLLGVEQRYATNLLEIHAHRVVEADSFDRLDGGDEGVVDLRDFLKVFALVRHLDAHLTEGVEDA